MTAGMRKTLVPALVICVFAILMLVLGIKIVPNGQRTSTDKSSSSVPAASSSAFDAAAYVDSVWAKELVPYFDGKANDLGKVIDSIKKDPDEAGKQFGNRADAEGSAWSFAVKGKATLVSVNTESRAGTLVVSIATDAGPMDVSLQIGPVVKGSSIRDSLPFFSFEKVTNQIEFAQVGRSFNDRAMAQIKADVPKLKVGDTLEFFGAMSFTGSTETFLITPISIKTTGGGAS